MSTPAPADTRSPMPLASPRVNPGAGIDYELFLDCIHCGLCLSACPTYEELQTEMDSPRGRIYLMRAVTDGRLAPDPHVRKHLDLCLDCRACESACPSGVRYHKLIEPFRLALEHDAPPALPWWQRLILRHLFPHARRDRAALAPMRWLQKSGLDGWLEKRGFYRLLPASMRHLRDMLPPLQRAPERLPEILPAEGPRRARVALFTGCVADAVYPGTNHATARVLQRNGCEVVIPRTHLCCGALPYHAGDPDQAARFARANCAAFGFGDRDLGPIDAIITNAAGCGAHLKEYGDLLDGFDPAHRFQARVRDIAEFLVELGPIAPEHPIPLKAAYHDACHLAHGQGIRSQPRQLLKMIPELDLVPLPESELCCGAAGSYNLTQPAMAERLGRRKAERILATGAQAVLTGNIGCLMQITRHLRSRRPEIWIAHPIDALWASYSGTAPARRRAASPARRGGSS